jgi:probable addiction module antidote protein
MATETFPFDPAKYFPDPQSQARLIADALETGEASYIAAALGTVARSRGMAQVARAAGVTRAALYKALSLEGDPQLTTLLGVMKALGVKLTAKTDEAA